MKTIEELQKDMDAHQKVHAVMNETRHEELATINARVDALEVSDKIHRWMYRLALVLVLIVGVMSIWPTA